MPVENQYHTSQTGAFYGIAVALSTHKLSFLSKNTVGPFICIIFGNIQISLLWFLLSCWYTHSSGKTRKRSKSSNTTDMKHILNYKASHNTNTPHSIAYQVSNSVSIVMLILLSGDFQINPGPTHNK